MNAARLVRLLLAGRDVLRSVPGAQVAGAGWCTCGVVMPLVFRHGAAEAAFIAALMAWLVFELVMRVRQRLRARGPAAWDRSALVLVPCLGASVVLAQVLGRRGGLPWPGAWSGRSWRALS
jgi:hypothetical protein